MIRLTGKKVKMTQIWKGDIVVPVTIVKLDETSDISTLAENAIIKVTGTTKGKGFAGVVKRHNFGGGPKTHGQKNRLRAPGSIGNTAAQRVIPGLRMAGHMGCITKSVKGLTVAEVRTESREVLIKGAVPGPRRGTVAISI